MGLEKTLAQLLVTTLNRQAIVNVLLPTKEQCLEYITRLVLPGLPETIVKSTRSTMGRGLNNTGRSKLVFQRTQLRLQHILVTTGTTVLPPKR